MPLADWLRQDTYYTMVREKFVGPVAERFFNTRALCDLLEAHRTGKVNAMTKIWSFYCFIVWYELYFVEDFSAPILKKCQKNLQNPLTCTGLFVIITLAACPYGHEPCAPVAQVDRATAF